MNRQEEACLVEKVQQFGCMTSYAKLVEGLNLYRDVYLYVQRYLSNPSDVEEITQEVMFRAFERISGYDASRGRLRSWVLGIAAHKACDTLRTRKRSFCEVWEELPSHQRSPEEMYELREIQSYLLHALAGIRGRSLRILQQFYVEGMSHEDIGHQEGISANNVGTILYRTRAQWLKKYQSLLNTNQRTRHIHTSNPALHSFSQMFGVLHQQMAQL